MIMFTDSYNLNVCNSLMTLAEPKASLFRGVTEVAEPDGHLLLS